MPEITFAVNLPELQAAALCTLVSLLAGIITAAAYTFRHIANRNFVITLALMPLIVQLIIMLVNGRVGTGVAVMGAFSLVRFRSVPGTAKEITSIFIAMALGLAAGTGHVGYALAFGLIINGLILLFSLIGPDEPAHQAQSLKIVIPEDLDYSCVFQDLFAQYTRQARLERVRTVNLGSLYELHYLIILKDRGLEKEFIDKLRARNSNLEISCGRASPAREEL